MPDDKGNLRMAAEMGVAFAKRVALTQLMTMVCGNDQHRVLPCIYPVHGI
ncbi:MAG: hypothetical protein M1499_08475 [Firmicutes bacterium]|nr:hypothetical protein [Bacillota bacterium]